jgi:uncharacterized damage-inducible protein DinB
VAQRAVDRRLIAVCDAPPESVHGITRIHRRGRVLEERSGPLLLHLFQHEIHHRGLLQAMLCGLAVKLPQRDAFRSADEGSLRAAQFADLGSP